MKQNPYIQLIKETYKYAGEKRRMFVMSIILLIVANSINMIHPYILGLLFNELQYPGENALQTAIVYLLIYTAIPFIFWIFHGPGRIYERTVSFEVVKNLECKLYEITSHLPLKWHKSNHSGSTIDRINKAKDALGTFSDGGFQLITLIIETLVSVIAISIIFPSGILFFVGIGAILLLAIRKFDHKISALKKQKNTKEHKVSATLYDYIGNIRTVISLKLEELSLNRLNKLIQVISPIHQKYIYVVEWKWFTINAAVVIAEMLVLGLYIYNVLGGNEALLIGNLLILYKYTENLVNSVFQFGWWWEKLIIYQADIEAIDGIISAQNETDKPVSKHKKIPSSWKQITIDKLNFVYEDEEVKETHLEDINFACKQGEKIALVGESGSGKSTLLTLLRCLDIPQQGKLKVDSIEFLFLALADTTTLIPQDPEIFEHTIAYNITMGLTHTEKELWEIAKLCRCDDVIKELPHGLHTNIQEKGVNLSGGQKQRLALCRGVFAAVKAESSIILLDEPTSSVDPLNESQIYDNLFANFSNHTIISSVHKLHLLEKFDTIYVMEAGRIMEYGSLNELKQLKGILSKMLQLST